MYPDKYFWIGTIVYIGVSSGLSYFFLMILFLLGAVAADILAKKLIAAYINKKEALWAEKGVLSEKFFIGYGKGSSG